MNITGNDAILLAHATLGVLGTAAALWVFVETLNAREQNAQRIRTAALAVALCMTAAWIIGGYWYLHYYPVERAMILKGPWPFAHNLFMETKEHLFLTTLILSFYLPIATRDRLYANAAARRMVLSVAMLIVLTGLSIEGAGAVIDHGVKVALLRPTPGRNRKMSAETAKLSRASTAFGMAAAITALFNTALACLKDGYRPLQNWMNGVAGHNWTTQGLADVILFVVLGVVVSNTRAAETIRANRVILFLIVAVAVGGAGLFAWYALF